MGSLQKLGMFLLAIQVGLAQSEPGIETTANVPVTTETSTLATTPIPDNICDIPNSTSARTVVPLNNGKGEVLCDTMSGDGGWLVFQRRKDGNVDFHRTWNEYKLGFGSVEKDFWLGLENLFHLCKRNCTLRVDFTYYTYHKDYFAEYQNFSLSGETDNYRLSIEKKVAGNVTRDDLLGEGGVKALETVNGQQFSTHDRDNDNEPLLDCAFMRGGAWWWNNCYNVNFNGNWMAWGPRALMWPSVTGDARSADFTELKVRVPQGADWMCLVTSDGTREK